jgi:hypothetical protein
MRTGILQTLQPLAEVAELKLPMEEHEKKLRELHLRCDYLTHALKQRVQDGDMAHKLTRESEHLPSSVESTAELHNGFSAIPVNNGRFPYINLLT